MAFALGTPEILMLIIVPILIIFVIREIVCWYSKINQRVELMKEQNTLLKNILKEINKTSQSIQDLSKEKETVKPESAPAKPVSAPTKQEPDSTMKETEVPVKNASPNAVIENADIVETPVAEKEQPAVKKVTNPYGFELSNEELEQVELLIKQDMLSGEQIVISKRTRKVAQFGIENWKCVDPTEWFILFEKP